MAQPKNVEAGKGGAEPLGQKRACLDPEVEDARRGRMLNIISRLITSSNPAERLQPGTFSREDILEAAYRVASFWIRSGHADKAEVLINTYGLRSATVEEMARAISNLPANGAPAEEEFWWPDSLGGEWELLPWRERLKTR